MKSTSNNNAAKNPFLAALLKGQEANLMVKQHAYAAGAAGANGTGQALDRLADAGQKVVDAIRYGAGECHKKGGEWAKKAESIKAQRKGEKPVAAEPTLLPAPEGVAEDEACEGFLKDVLPVIQEALVIRPGLGEHLMKVQGKASYGIEVAVMDGNLLEVLWTQEGALVWEVIDLRTGKIVDEGVSDED